MARLRNVLALGPIAVLGALAVGCSSEPSTDRAIDDTSDDALLSSSCEDEAPRRYDALLADGVDCANVRAENGTWLGRPLFADAPTEVKSKSCRFTWRGRHAGDAPDSSALETATDGSRLAATCARGKPPTIPAVEDDSEPQITPMGGTVGCDVCGVIRGGKIWLVPPHDLDRIHLTPRLLDAATGEPVRTVRMVAQNATNAQSLVVKLPAPPAGTRWADGPIGIDGRF